MILKILLTGDVNLMNVTNPADPFAKVATEFESADLVFSNLECCFYEPDAAHALDREGFFAPLASAEAAVIDVIGDADRINARNFQRQRRVMSAFDPKRTSRNLDTTQRPTGSRCVWATKPLVPRWPAALRVRRTQFERCRSQAPR